MDYSAFGMVENRDLLDFSQNFAVTRNYVGSRLFPDRKTQYLQAEYSRLMKNGNLPQIAEVHAFDTEAKIGERVGFENVNVEKLLIKEKINQTEAIREITNGMRMDNVQQYIFDDIARQAEKVVTRVEKAKIDAITQGQYIIKENNLNLVVDYGIPEENKVKTWWDADADVLGDLITWTDQASDNGPTPTHAITTRKVFRKIAGNKGIQRQVYGNDGVGRVPTLAEVNRVLADQVQITLIIDEDKYGVLEAGAMKSYRFFPEDTFVLFAAGTGEAIGTGLWGVTPEERGGSEAFTMMSERQYVTVTQWATPDPVAVWTKASGLFVPVIPNVYSHIIANIADESSKPEKTLSDVSLPLSVENGGTGAATADNARTNLDVYSKSEVDGKVAG